MCGEDLACFIISGVLNRGIDNPARANVSYCYSTLIVTPGILDNKTAELMACPQGNNYRSLNVTCEVTGHCNTSEITQIQDPQLFQIAGKSICDMVAALPLYHGTLFVFFVCVGVPGMPDSQSITCYYYHSSSSVTVQIGMPNSFNTDLDYCKAELFCDGNLLGTNLVKLPDIVDSTDLRTPQQHLI